MINPGTGPAWLRSHAYSEDGIMITDYSHMMETGKASLLLSRARYVPAKFSSPNPKLPLVMTEAVARTLVPRLTHPQILRIRDPMVDSVCDRSQTV